MYSCRPLHMDEQKQDDQSESKYNSSVPIRDVAPKSCRKQWTIGRGGEWGSGISVLMAQHDDGDLLTQVARSNKYYVLHCGCYVRSWSYYWSRSCWTSELKKYDVFYTSAIPEVTWYEPLYNNNRTSRMWHKVNSLNGAKLVWIQSFPSIGLVAQQRLKNLFCISRMWHKVNFLNRVKLVWILSFPSHVLVAQLRLKNPICLTI